MEEEKSIKLLGNVEKINIASTSKAVYIDPALIDELDILKIKYKYATRKEFLTRIINDWMKVEKDVSDATAQHNEARRINDIIGNFDNETVKIKEVKQ